MDPTSIQGLVRVLVIVDSLRGAKPALSQVSELLKTLTVVIGTTMICNINSIEIPQLRRQILDRPPKNDQKFGTRWVSQQRVMYEK